MITLALRHRFPGMAMDIAFTAPTPGTTVLFGPSGSGKSTAVAALAGLLRPDHLHASIDGVVLADTGHRVWLPPERRRIGLVFQDARLFPHMDVATNLRYGLRRAPAGDIRFDDVVSLLGIAPLLAQHPHTLSGGERQRVAIGRALLSQPRLLLMDEPLSGLDAARKAEILPYLARLKTALSLPIVYVTHDMEELTRLADTLVLIEAGRVVAAGPIGELTAQSGLSLAARDDAGAVLTLAVTGHDPARRLTRLEGQGIALLVPLLDQSGTARIRIPAREVILANAVPTAISIQNALTGQVRVVTDDPARHQALVEITVGTATVLARVTPDAVHRLDLRVGSSIHVLIKSSSVDVLSD